MVKRQSWKIWMCTLASLASPVKEDKEVWVMDTSTSLRSQFIINIKVRERGMK